MTTHTRRNFLATLGVAALGIASRDALAATEILAPRRKLKKVGLQLYSVRDLMKADLPGTLAKVAAIGYKEVEFAGYFGRTPAQIRELLRRDGLASPSTTWRSNRWTPPGKSSSTMRRPSATIGRRLPTSLRTSVGRSMTEATRRDVQSRRRASEVGRPRFAYHNHDFEFKASTVLGPSTFCSRRPIRRWSTSRWISTGLCSAEETDRPLQSVPEAFPLVHVKVPRDRGQEDGRCRERDRSTSLHLAQSEKAGIKHYFVEHDQPADPIATIRKQLQLSARPEILIAT